MGSEENDKGKKPLHISEDKIRTLEVHETDDVVEALPSEPQDVPSPPHS